MEGCGAEFPEKSFDWEKIKSMGQTNPTRQRELLEKRANILHVKHRWDVSILYSHKHARGDTVQGYGTPGIGAKFIGKEKDNVSEAGRAAWNLFAKFADNERQASEEDKDGDETPVTDYTTTPTSTLSSPTSTLPASTSTLPASTSSLLIPNSTLPTPISTLPASTSSLHTPTSTPPTPTSTLPASISSLPTPTSSLPSPTLSNFTPTSSRPIPNSPLPSFNSSLSSTQSASTASRMLAYVENKIVKAIGFAMPERKVLHGKSIPQGSMCMQLQYTGKDVPASVVLGNDDENSYLQAGMFFALPIENLFFLYWHPK
ncbi:unnamed protein product [Pocillopora meandrina]|uniref:Uncharacterized protein n=1 Tax=Pocillopora meandrina TaxID=46732 RepID=A0AAU9X2M6_9CNID|nr:unnamed protein product [Pocillopora meandrina]